jgi:hypothetical protein
MPMSRYGSFLNVRAKLSPGYRRSSCPHSRISTDELLLLAPEAERRVRIGPDSECQSADIVDDLPSAKMRGPGEGGGKIGVADACDAMMKPESAINCVRRGRGASAGVQDTKLGAGTPRAAPRRSDPAFTDSSRGGNRSRFNLLKWFLFGVIEW